MTQSAMRTVSRDFGFMPACRQRTRARPSALSERWSHKQLRPASQDRRTRNKTLPARAAADATMLAAPLVQAFQGVADTYGSALQHYPLETKAGTTALTYGMGDIMAQSADNRRMGRQSGLDIIRLRNFAVSGVGGGLLWSWWYGFLDTRLHEVGIEPGATATAISIVVEQFVWAPIFFGLYFLPLTSFMRWRSPENITSDVTAEIGPTLWANAKVWTLLNVVIYNAPLDIRVLVSNSGDLLWSAYLSFLVQDTCSEDDEVCIAEKDNVMAFVWEEATAGARNGSSQKPSSPTSASSGRELEPATIDGSLVSAISNEPVASTAKAPVEVDRPSQL